MVKKFSWQAKALTHFQPELIDFLIQKKRFFLDILSSLVVRPSDETLQLYHWRTDIFQHIKIARLFLSSED